MSESNDLDEKLVAAFGVLCEAGFLFGGGVDDYYEGEAITVTYERIMPEDFRNGFEIAKSAFEAMDIKAGEFIFTRKEVSVGEGLVLISPNEELHVFLGVDVGAGLPVFVGYDWHHDLELETPSASTFAVVVKLEIPDEIRAELMEQYLRKVAGKAPTRTSHPI